MKNRIHRNVLSFAVLSLAFACEREAPTNETTAPSPESAKSGVQEPGAVQPSDTATAMKKLALEVVTGSEEGFLVTSTLVKGEKDAILVDAQFTLADAKKVADAVAASGKNLTTVFVTHSHPDHYFGFPAIKERFPNARLVALPQTVADIQKTWEAKVKQWKPQYKDAITSKPVVPEPLGTNTLDLEGQKLEVVGAQQGDSADNSYVWIPSLKTVITGDIVYDGVFPWTAETTPEARKAWAGTLDKIAALKPDQVAPGHKKADRQLNAESIAFTKNYLVSFDEALATSKTPTELQGKIKSKYPDTALDVIVKIGADAAFKKPAQGEPGAAPAEKAQPTATPTTQKAPGTQPSPGTPASPTSP